MTNTSDKTNNLFITLEGDDGVGKSTQADLLAQWLENQGIVVTRVHEPGKTRLGEKIRELLLSKEQDDMTPMAELLLYEAARAQVMATVIEPALARGEAVVCDRFTDSTLAYQGYGRELGASLVSNINDIACNKCYPRRTLLLVLDDALAKQRVSSRAQGGQGDRMECVGTAFRERLSKGFADIAAQDPARVHVIDASGSIEQVHERICNDIADLIKPKVCGC